MNIKKELIIRKEKDFGIVFNTVTNVQEFYNDIGIDILSLCNEGYKIDQIIDILVENYDTKKENIEKDVLEFINEEKEKGIVEV